MGKFYTNRKTERLGEEKINNQGCLMKIIEYYDVHNIIVEFQDEEHTRVKSEYKVFKMGSVNNPSLVKRVGVENVNKDGDIMKVVQYNRHNDIIVEFQDDYLGKVHTTWGNFKNGGVKNPYHPNRFGGIVGQNYLLQEKDGRSTKEFDAWIDMLKRCHLGKSGAKKYTAYKDVYVCEEWLFFDTFYTWITSQSNYTCWNTTPDWAIDKDILIKGNKIYSPDTCCLVPKNINNLFTKNEDRRGNYPIGVTYNKKNNNFRAQCSQNDGTGQIQLGSYDNFIDAFYAYKKYKEKLIKNIAQEEYKQNRITKECYDAMMNYEVEITD